MKYCAFCSSDKAAVDSDPTICNICVSRIYCHQRYTNEAVLLCVTCINILYDILDPDINPLSRLCERCLSRVAHLRKTSNTPIIELYVIDKKSVLGKIRSIHASTIMDRWIHGYIIQIRGLTDSGYLVTSRRNIAIGDNVDVYDLGINDGKHIFGSVD
jgi:hypothetical protein